MLPIRGAPLRPDRGRDLARDRDANPPDQNLKRILYGTLLSHGAENFQFNPSGGYVLLRQAQDGIAAKRGYCGAKDLGSARFVTRKANPRPVIA